MLRMDKKNREVVLCIKATGYKPEEGDRIEEVACVELIDGKESGKTFHSFINLEGKMIDDNACDITKISKEAMKAFSNGKHFSEIEKELMDFIQPNKDQKANLVVFNKSYILRHLQNAMPAFEPSKMVNVEDVLHTAKISAPKDTSHTFDSLLKKFDISKPARTHYSAKQDAELLVKLHANLSDEKLHQAFASDMSLFSKPVAKKSVKPAVAVQAEPAISHYNTRSHKM